jgi:hypothetical protein
MRQWPISRASVQECVRCRWCTTTILGEGSPRTTDATDAAAAATTTSGNQAIANATHIIASSIAHCIAIGIERLGAPGHSRRNASAVAQTGSARIAGRIGAGAWTTETQVETHEPE